ncbi:MAG: thiamine-monophosphate kinase [Planctomycetes bacterium]|nr:thiamine-monophosphate kinase [Planctomycetota bacterium]
MVEEFSFINWIRGRTDLDAENFPVGPGDDCAVMRVGGQLLLVTTDQCCDGVHFVLQQCGARQAGYKGMARSLSDIAAMGGEPMAAVATVAMPRGMDDSQAEQLYLGLRCAGDAFRCPIIGGDVSVWNNPLLLTVTMLGRPVAAKPILRSGAVTGDAICVTGSLGGSQVSGKHLSFTPRIEEARELVFRYPIHAMIDISDGLASDLGHICRESAAGADLWAEAIPISTEAAGREDPLAAALGDGEDYELLFTLADGDAKKLLADQPLEVPVTRIGTITAAKELHLLGKDGKVALWVETGFRHRT